MISSLLSVAYLQHTLVLDRNRSSRGGADGGNDRSQLRYSHVELLFVRQAKSRQKGFAVVQRVVLVGLVFGGYENVDVHVRD